MRFHLTTPELTYIPPGWTSKDVIRFWSYAQVGESSACWPWLGNLIRTGYGRYSFGGKSNAAHRLALTFVAGPVGVGLVVAHSCDNPRCVNPGHLRATTQAGNRAECFAKRRHAHGETHGMSKLDGVRVQEIIEHIGAGEGDQEIARLYEVSYATIHNIRNGSKWARVPRPWQEKGVVAPRGRRAGDHLTDQDIPVILGLLCAKVGQDDIAARFGVTQGAIHEIRAGETWKHIPRPPELPPLRGFTHRTTEITCAVLAEAQKGYGPTRIAANLGLGYGMVWRVLHSATP